MSEILKQIRKDKIVAVIRRMDQGKFNPVIFSLLEGGIRSVEITMDGANAIEQIRQLTTEYKNQLNVGAGTVMTIEQATTAVEAGAKFLVCPHLDVHLLRHAVTLEVPIVPGVMTPTEIQTAIIAGATFVKIFPASVLGPGFVKDLLGPFSGLQIMVTGGLNADNFHSYIKAGASVVGLGSSLFPKEDIDNEDWASISQRARFVMSSIVE